MSSPARSGSKRRASDRDISGQAADIALVPDRYREQIEAGLRRTLERARTPDQARGACIAPQVDDFYRQMEYHFGWRDSKLQTARGNPGKLLRPILLLLGCELAAIAQGRSASDTTDLVARALPAALAVEIVHNFSLVHDDIEDGDEERRHRPTLWRVWGQPQAINTGDGMFALARLTLFELLDMEVPAALVARLAVLLDRTCLRLCEGQHLDMSFEGRHDVTPRMYMAMIERKTAALMECALEMGALLGGADDALAQRLAAFGNALGLAFQLRDDLLGIWASRNALGKAEAGDLRRKKMSLPVIYAREHATHTDRATLDAIYADSGPATAEQVRMALNVLERTGARAGVQATLREQCGRAREALAGTADVCVGGLEPQPDAYRLLAALVDFVAAEVE